MKKKLEEDNEELFDKLEMTTSFLDVVTGNGSFVDWVIIILGAISRFFTTIFRRR